MIEFDLHWILYRLLSSFLVSRLECASFLGSTFLTNRDLNQLSCLFLWHDSANPLQTSKSHFLKNYKDGKCYFYNHSKPFLMTTTSFLISRFMERPGQHLSILRHEDWRAETNKAATPRTPIMGSWQNANTAGRRRHCFDLRRGK